MKIQSIKSYTPSINHTQKMNSQHVTFGFGEDYGDDNFLIESDHSSGGNLFEYLGLIIAFPFSWLADIINQKRAEKRYRENPEAFDNKEFDAFEKVDD